MSIKASCNHGNLDLPIKGRVLHCSKNDIRLWMRSSADDIRRFIDLKQRQVHAAGDIEQDASGPTDVYVQ